MKLPNREMILILSIDSQIQFLAYKALKEEVTRRYANAGTAVVLNVETGEILAMVSQPSYQPEQSSKLRPAAGWLEKQSNSRVFRARINSENISP